jgi:hypothetical protein
MYFYTGEDDAPAKDFAICALDVYIHKYMYMHVMYKYVYCIIAYICVYLSIYINT